MQQNRTTTSGSSRPAPRQRTSAPAQRAATPRRTSRQASGQYRQQPAPSRRTPQANRRGQGQRQATPPSSAKRYITSLDGLRAFAVIAVILYHLNVPFAKGGLLGVTVFFVISGYLITGLLTAEWEQSGTIRLLQFWLRRIRRLFPAIVTVIVVMAALYALFSPVLLTKMRPDIVPGLFWFTNWWYILRDISYFDAIGAPSPLTHFWSLAIEEQFYLVWPIVLLGVYKAGADKTVVRRGCLVLAAASAIAMAVLFDPHGDPSRVYYGTDTRAFSLLIGAWLSFVWPGTQVPENSDRSVFGLPARAVDAAGVVAFVAIVAMCVLVDGFSDFMYYGGLLLCSVLTAVVIAALATPQSLFARVASLRPFVWVGQRSYGMYLWHFPIILLLAQLLDVHGTYPWWFDVLVIVVVFAISAASYRFIENPIRRGAIGDWVRGVRSGAIQPAAFFQGHVAPTVAVVVVAGVAVVGCAVVPDTYLVPKEAIQSTGEAADEAMDVSSLLSAQASASAQSPEAWPDAGSNVTFAGFSPVLIGDSVPGDTIAEFDNAFPNGLNDSYTGRFPFQAAEVLQGYVDQDAVGKVVVMACFSNSTVRDGDLDAILEVAGPDRHIYLVNCYVTEGFMDDQNSALQAFADQHDNVRVIDWESLVTPHASEWIYPDGTHLTPGAYQIYVGMILDAISADLKPEEIGAPVSDSPLPDDYGGEVASVNKVHQA